MNNFTPEKQEKDKEKQRKLSEQLWTYSAVGIEMGAAVGIGAGIGVLLDRKFGTDPWLTLIFLMLGIAAAFMAFFRLVRQVSPTHDKDESGSSE